METDYIPHSDSPDLVADVTVLCAPLAPAPKPWAAAICLWLLNVGDILTTLIGVSRGATEANPLMRVLLAWGPYWFVVIKLSVMTAVIGLGLRWRTRGAMWTMAAVFAAVVGSNLAVWWHLVGRS